MMTSSKRTWRKQALSVAIGLCLAVLSVPPALAGNNDGSVVGNAEAGAVITVTSPSTGLTRTVTADAKGNYRFAFLPIGDYTLEASKDGQSLGAARNVTVTLGNATTVNLAGATSSLETIAVTASVINAVDVTSTEIATNVSRQDLARIPVEQSVGAVATLAPGVNKGTAGFGGLTFGGSSVAENSYYVNGLNVTDFYNRNGFSEAPFAFYQEFQVKTGGYSVEFGRSTGGVVNAVTRSGSNEFHYGAELTVQPDEWESSGRNAYNADGSLNVVSSHDRDSLTKLNVYASGAIVPDTLFFFLMYEGRDGKPYNTNDDGTTITYNDSGDGFWGGKIDWHVNDKNLIELMAFNNSNSNVGSVYDYDLDSSSRGDKTNEIYTDTGGKNWNATWTSYLTNDLSMKLMYGENDRENFNRALSDLDCNRVVRSDSRVPLPDAPLGCTTNSTVASRQDTRKAARADFEWKLGDHLLRFGLDHEENTSDYSRYYPGPGAAFYNIYYGTPGTTIPNGGIVPDGYTAYVRARRNEIAGVFKTVDGAYYIEDNWNITPTFLLNAGVRLDAFDNQDGSGRSYIKTSDQLAPRLGFSWDMNGDGSTKLFGNLGRYFLPVANVINIKQGGGLLDQRTYYAFGGWDIQQHNGADYALPILGPQIGAVDVSQGDGTVGDLRSEVDHDIDPVFQDEAILGFQKMLDETWSWGISGTYRKLHNAIDDMEISATPQCGGDGYIGYVMGNPGRQLTVWGDSNCDGDADSYLSIDTSKEGFAIYDSDGNYLGQTGWVTPRRDYRSLEFQLDHAWDGKWALNASYVLSYSRGNAEGPVNTDTNFDDTGRTENFDDPWVNLNGFGDLANDHRHQFKLRGSYALDDHWLFGGNLTALSGGPITGFGVGNPFDATNYHSYYICVSPSCNDPDAPSESRQYELSPRGAYGTTPWTETVDASVSYLMGLGEKGKLQVKFSVYNLFNQRKTIAVDQDLQTDITTDTNPNFRQPIRFQAPRSATLTVTATF
jgi:hypothetical protein